VPGDNGTCPNTITFEKYCPDCAPKTPWAKKTKSSTLTSTAAWKRLRLKVLARDGHECQERGPYCTGYATQVDHVVNVGSGGAALDPANLQSICPACDARKAQREAVAAH